MACGVLQSLHFNVNNASINNAVKTFLFQHLAKKDQNSNLGLKPFPARSVIETRLPYDWCEMIKTVALIQCCIVIFFLWSTKGNSLFCVGSVHSNSEPMLQLFYRLLLWDRMSIDSQQTNYFCFIWLFKPSCWKYQAEIHLGKRRKQRIMKENISKGYL